VLGFDDISDARYSVPSLTTVRQPLRRQGKLAVDVLLRRLRGEQVEKEYVLPAELIVRRSCGCYPDAHRPAPVATASAQAAAGHGGAEGALRRGRPRILKAMREAVGRQPDGFPADWEEALLEAAVVEAGGGEAGFIGRIRELLSETIGPAATGHPLRPALAALEHELLPCLVADEAMHRRAEERLAEAHFLVSEAIEDSHIHYRLMIERRRRSLSEATESLSAAFDLASLSDALRDSLPRLGVPSAYLVLDGSTGAGEARVVFAHDSRRNPLELEQLTCVPLQGMCLPDGLLPDDRTFAMVVEPLYFKDDRLGYAMFEMTARDAFTYDAFGALRVRISGAVKVALLIEELQVRVGQLRQAQKMETLGQLSGAIAHDFNNLLQAIRGYAELASLAPPGSPEAATDLEEIVRAADRASQLTRQLLTFSQPTRANARVVDLSSSVEQALPLIRRLLGPAIEITTSLSPDAGSILIDPAQLEQALINLCVNSRDAMREGGSLSIETGRKFVAGGPAAGAGLAAGRDLPAGLLSTVCIADTGAGIEPEIKERIFEPFFTTKDTGQGTGLGLSIVYGIVRGASGEITVESAVGRGTRVCLAFPTTTGTEESVEVPDGAMIRGSETILLVEDEDAIRKLARRVLIDAGYRVLSAANGEEARKLWATHEGRVDLLLTDVTMPRLSGVALASELTSGAARPPRMLFISGRLPGHEGGPELPAGAVFLPKPFSVAALLDAVRATLDSAPSRPGS
jgi:signal transduction histidine kinase/CheY-like chemotaxis protein